MAEVSVKSIIFASLFVAHPFLPIVGLQDASAQMTQQTCMDMGGGMTSCQGMTFGNSNSVDSSSSSNPSNGDNGQGALAAGLGKLIFGDREGRFRREVGRMLAEGKCREAAAYAYESGRLELGSQIASSCPSAAQRSAPSITPENLEDNLQRLADNVRTPFQFDEITEITDVSAFGRQLLFTASIKTDENLISENSRRQITNYLCADNISPQLLGAGGSIRVVLHNNSGSELGAVMVNRSICGF